MLVSGLHKECLYLGPYGPLFSLYFNIWVRSPPALFRKKKSYINRYMVHRSPMDRMIYF